jgi:hypothetical protein
VVSVLVTRQPVLHAGGVVQARISPAEVCRGRGPTAARRAHG